MLSRFRLASLLVPLIGAATFASPIPAADVEFQLDAGGAFVIKNNDGSVERFRVDEATGNISRNGALFVHTTGGLFVGGAGNTSISGSNNTAVGEDALSSDTSGADNSAFGYHALHYNTVGSDNSAFGEFALHSNTSGDRNAAFGQHTLFANTTGSDNSAFGANALDTNTTGYQNAAFGDEALTANTEGHSNVAIGSYALDSNTTGDRNVAVGRVAGGNQTTGSDNIYLSNVGVAGESGQIKIGTTGVHTNTTIAGQVAIPSTADLDLSADGAVMLGLESGKNVVMDNDEIQARNNGAIASLCINCEGGDLILGSLSPVGVVKVPWINANADVRTDGSSPPILYGFTSTRRHKRNIESFEDDYTKILELSPVTFEYLDEPNFPKGEFMGYLAEDLDEHGMPYLVRYDDEGRPANINYDQMSVYLVELVKRHRSTLAEQGEQIEAQQRAIAEREQRNTDLLARLEQLESRLATAGEGVER